MSDDDKRTIEWDAENQSPDELASATFEAMVADGLPVDIAARMSEEVKQRVVHIVEHERLRVTCQSLSYRLRDLRFWTWLLSSTAVFQAVAIVILTSWHWSALVVEGMVIGLVAWVSVNLLR